MNKKVNNRIEKRVETTANDNTWGVTHFSPTCRLIECNYDVNNTINRQLILWSCVLFCWSNFWIWNELNWMMDSVKATKCAPFLIIVRKTQFNWMHECTINHKIGHTKCYFDFEWHSFIHWRMKLQQNSSDSQQLFLCISFYYCSRSVHVKRAKISITFFAQWLMGFCRVILMNGGNRAKVNLDWIQ